MYRFVYIVSALLLVLAFPARSLAVKFDLSPGLTQSEFKHLVKDLGSATAYVPLAPAEPLGILGIDLGVEATLVNIAQAQSYWKNAVENADVPTVLVFPRVHVQKGLPFGVDVGLSYSKVPSSLIEMGLIGAEIKWAVLKGTLATPALAVRASYTKLLGVDALNLQTYGADVSISKGFANVTPYAGVGQTWASGKEKSGAVDLNNETVSMTRGFVGAKVSIFLVNFVGEVEFSEVTSYSLRANLSF